VLYRLRSKRAATYPQRCPQNFVFVFLPFFHTMGVASPMPEMVYSTSLKQNFEMIDLRVVIVGLSVTARLLVVNEMRPFLGQP